MSSPLVLKATVQAILIGAVSNVVGQAISAQQGNKPFSFDVQTFIFFLVWTLVSCPPNILWQIYLEQRFPASKRDVKTGEKSLSKGNTIKKFLMDQSFGATANTVGYIAALAAWRGNDSAAVKAEVQKNFWPIMQAGWRVWPFFSLLSFTIIPLDKRPLAGSLVGFAWSIYMSLLAAR